MTKRGAKTVAEKIHYYACFDRFSIITKVDARSRRGYVRLSDCQLSKLVSEVHIQVCLFLNLVFFPRAWCFCCDN